MTKFKVCSKIHLFIIISTIFIAIGLAVGTICHFCANGFFNYGNEFQSYKSVTVTYALSEYKDDETIKPVLEAELDGLNAYSVSYSGERKEGVYGEVEYKFTAKTDSAKLQKAVENINAKFSEKVENGENPLTSAEMHTVSVSEGGSKAITFASIAVASAAAFQFIYFVIRYKLRAAFSGLLANVHNLGVFVALAAITRIPVGIEMVAIAAAVVLLTIIISCVLFDRTRKNFANEKYAKEKRLDVVDTSACEVRMVTFVTLCALAVAAVIFGVFAAIAQLWAGALAPFALAVLGLVACGYGTIFFTPAVHGGIDGVCETVKKLSKSDKKGKAAKVSKTADTAESV
ncbi:MAG: hypothetical protein K2K39_01850 [Clostridia bacterium]|nr:hypothetical protein [Clostridia bacterium]